MNLWKVAVLSFGYYRSTNLAIALGVAAATAVLTGALIVGDSMRHSLKKLTMERLGQIDEILVSDGFFRVQLASEIQQLPSFTEHYDQIAPLILFPGGTVETEPRDETKGDDAVNRVRRSGRVTVLGITDDFWKFESEPEVQQLAAGFNSLTGNVAMINQTLADDLQISPADVDAGQATITVRVPKQTQLPADSFLGRKTDLIESLVNLQVVQIVPTRGLGRFGMFPTQSDPANVYLPIELLQEALSYSILSHKADPNQANALLLSGTGDQPPTPQVSSTLRKQMRPSMADYGLGLKHVQQFLGEGENRELVFEYWSLSSDRMLMTDEAVASVERAIPRAKPIFTYMANDIRLASEESGVPFSMVTGINFDDRFDPVSAVSGEPIDAFGNQQIVLNEWAARDLNAKIGDKIALTFFEPETTHGSQVERTVEFELVDIAKLAEPGRGFVRRGRDGLEPAVYFDQPTQANDPDLTPSVPGVTDANSIDEWELPFSTADRLRPQDDDYWEFYRTTPKAFVNLEVAQDLWNSRFGKTTSFRIPIDAGTEAELSDSLLQQFAADEAQLGMHLVPIKRRGLSASSGSTPFDVLFLLLSMFVIGSALILVSLLFRLGVQQRADQVGLMKAAGFTGPRLRNVWLLEMLLVSTAGAVLGVLLGVGYAALMIQGLTSWWVGAISRPFLEMHLTPLTLAIGLISGLLICVGTIWFSLRRTGRQPVTQLLRGQLEDVDQPVTQQRASWGSWMRWLMVLLAIGLAISAIGLSGEAQAGAFMGSGFLALAAGLMSVYRWLKAPGDTREASRLSLSRLALLSAKRNPLRSTLTIGLVAVASFLIAAVSAFRLKPTEAGTAGFDWVATSSQPVFENLATSDGQINALGEEFQLPAETDVLSLRYKAGEDASCNNLYQSTQPQALGLPKMFINRFDDPQQPAFAWGGSLAEDERELENPWQLLDVKQAHAGTAEDPVPVVIDKNTANYSLKIYSLGTVREVEYDTGERFHFKVVGFLANTILQGSLIMSETDFETAFPSVSGYQFFLIDDAEADNSAAEQEAPMPPGVAILEDRLGYQGFDARSANRLLANYMAVQNTYLSTFQTLGALGLLLGTFGLAAVQIRSVLERRRELGLMRAVGFEVPRLSSMVMLENTWLLSAGLAVGVGAALFTTIPHWLVGAASVPWLALLAIFSGIAFVGLLAGWLASRNISNVPLLDSLRR